MHFGLNPPACAGSTGVCVSVVPGIGCEALMIVTPGACGAVWAQEEVKSAARGMTGPHPLAARQVRLGMVEPPCIGWLGRWVGTR